MFVSHPPSAYDLFLTAAVADGIKLWDLRTNRCARRYDGHVNRSQPVGLAISPCARFIATGSEDRSVSRPRSKPQFSLLLDNSFLSHLIFECNGGKEKGVSIAWVFCGNSRSLFHPVCHT